MANLSNASSKRSTATGVSRSLRRDKDTLIEIPSMNSSMAIHRRYSAIKRNQGNGMIEQRGGLSQSIGMTESNTSMSQGQTPDSSIELSLELSIELSLGIATKGTAIQDSMKNGKKCTLREVIIIPMTRDSLIESTEKPTKSSKIQMLLVTADTEA